MKRNQQLEREKQAQLLNEVKKQEDQKDETTEYFQVTTQAYSGLMVRTLIFGSSGPGSSPGLVHYVLLLVKTLYSHSASLHPGVLMGTGKLNAGSNPAMD